MASGSATRCWEDYFRNTAAILLQAKRWLDQDHPDLVLRFAPELIGSELGQTLLQEAISSATDIQTTTELLINKQVILKLPEGRKIVDTFSSVFVFFDAPTLAGMRKIRSSPFLKNSQELVTNLIRSRAKLGYPAVPYAEAIKMALPEAEWHSLLLEEVTALAKESKQDLETWAASPSHCTVYQSLFPDRWGGFLETILQSKQESAELLAYASHLQTAFPARWQSLLHPSLLKLIAKGYFSPIEKDLVIKNWPLIKSTLHEAEWQMLLLSLKQQNIAADYCLDILEQHGDLYELASHDQWKIHLKNKLNLLLKTEQWAHLLSHQALFEKHLETDLCQKALQRATAEIRQLKEQELIALYSPKPFNFEQMEIIIKNTEACEVSVLKERCLRSIKILNDRHELPDASRFLSVSRLPSWQLYDLITQGAEEAYTSTFNGLFSRMLLNLQKEGIDGLGLFRLARNRKFRMMACKSAQYNRLKELLSAMPPHSGNLLLARIIEGLDKEPDMLKEAVAVAEMLGTFDEPNKYPLLLIKLKNEHERVKSADHQNAALVYGLLASLFVKKTNLEDGWLHSMEKKYPAPNLDYLHSSELRDRQHKIYVRFLFYNDEDGLITQNSFLKKYSQDSNWAIKDKGTYYHLQSRNDRMECFANKFDQAESGNDAINQQLLDKKVGIVVHRGHSYYMHNTLPRIRRDTQLVILGSCGGFSQLLPILHIAPEAQILATKGKGSTSINEPVIKEIFDEILTGKEQINWQNFWTKMEKKYGKYGTDFQNYVPPHKNASVVFIKAYQGSYIQSPARGIKPKQSLLWIAVSATCFGLLWLYRKRLIKRDDAERKKRC